MTEAIRPFQLSIPESDLEDLRRRLTVTRWPDAETPDDWSQGIPLSYMQEICRYWANDYDWRPCEELLNGWEQFQTVIDGVDIHFLHVKSPHSEALPLLITHGWPGSVLEFRHVIGPLTDPVAHGGKAEDAFHVIAPSLPGYGYSGKPSSPGWSVNKIADAWGQLMARLGYDKYVAQGGDWGSIITRQVGVRDDTHCIGIHLNMVSVRPDPDTMGDLTEFEKKALASAKHYKDWDSGYSKQQSTRPQTLGYALADSPLGQAAWIIEKFWAWTDCDGHPENAIRRDDMLDNVMVYWLTNSAASSARLYWESFGKIRHDTVKVPVGCSLFPKEIFSASRRWSEKTFENIVHWNELDKGGHFAAMEQPEIFVDELRTCFRAVR